MMRWRKLNAVGAAVTTVLVIVTGCAISPAAERSTSPIPSTLPTVTAADESQPPVPTARLSPSGRFEPSAAPSFASPFPTPPDPTPEPTPIPTPEPTPLASLSSGPLRIDGLALVVVDGLRVRSAPGTDADSSIRGEALTKGREVFVVAGPEPANGYLWWQAQGLTGTGAFGWIAAAGRDGEIWVSPATVACPADPSIADLAWLGGARSLACYGGRDLQIRAFRQQFCGDGIASGAGSPRWINEVFGGDALFDREWHWGDETALDETALEIYGRAHPSLLESGTPYFNCSEEGTGWFDVTGHFDDPVSSDCRFTYFDDLTSGEREMEPALSITACRQTFVYADLHPASGP
jgi:hypothetical protein